MPFFVIEKTVVHRVRIEADNASEAVDMADDTPFESWDEETEGDARVLKSEQI